MLEIIRNLLLTLSALAAIVSLYLKTFSNLFMEVIKSRYKNVPGKQSTFEIVISWISYIAVTAYMIFALIYIVGILISDKSIVEFVSRNYFSLTFLFAATIFSVSLYGVYYSIVLFPEYKKKFILKLENKPIKNVGEKQIRINKRSRIISAIVSAVFLFLICLLIVQGIKIVKYEGVYIFENNIDNMNIIIFLSFIVFLNVTSFIVLSSLKEVMIAINSKDIYMLYTDKKAIICNCYLEYSEYYLIFEEGIERYIKKSEIKEIRKKELH